MSLPHMPLFIDDLEAAIVHLNLEEDGAYNRLLRLCWRSPDCSIPDDDVWIQRHLRVDKSTFERAVLPVLAEFFQRSKSRVFQKRQRAVFEEVSGKVSAKKEAGKKGGLAKSAKSKENQPSNTTDLPVAKAYQNPSSALASISISKTISKEDKSVTAEAVPQPELFPAEERQKPPPKPALKSEPKRRVQFPEDWTPSEGCVEFAKEQGIWGSRLSEMVRHCVDTHLSLIHI